MPPRALEPAGVALVDKPAGPSSFAIVAQIRRVTGAKTGHAGTLDPFATGLLLILSGRSTKLASTVVGLDKRYLTDIDLSATTTTGDPEGEIVERHDSPDELDLDRLRGEIELPVPAASAVKIGGELKGHGAEVDVITFHLVGGGASEVEEIVDERRHVLRGVLQPMEHLAAVGIERR